MSEKKMILDDASYLSGVGHGQGAKTDVAELARCGVR